MAFLSCYGFGEVGVAFTLLGRTVWRPKVTLYIIHGQNNVRLMFVRLRSSIYSP